MGAGTALASRPKGFERTPLEESEGHEVSPGVLTKPPWLRAPGLHLRPGNSFYFLAHEESGIEESPTSKETQPHVDTVLYGVSMGEGRQRQGADMPLTYTTQKRGYRGHVTHRPRSQALVTVSGPARTSVLDSLLGVVAASTELQSLHKGSLVEWPGAGKLGWSCLRLFLPGQALEAGQD